MPIHNPILNGNSSQWNTIIKSQLSVQTKIAENKIELIERNQLYNIDQMLF